MGIHVARSLVLTTALVSRQHVASAVSAYRRRLARHVSSMWICVRLDCTTALAHCRLNATARAVHLCVNAKRDLPENLCWAVSASVLTSTSVLLSRGMNTVTMWSVPFASTLLARIIAAVGDALLNGSRQVFIVVLVSRSLGNYCKEDIILNINN